ncbi:hypothetical protein [Tuwongella immobilis]|uniref:Uncharacterized protein n=1 Tax=Tuwongella immobilis TaxID=692036 RepID=A0A6C2YKK1_9BACT|nr:hypothetical protein [Tuwongella immobilis]VIP02098.1 unnamed protein product [Tuwongella immobilis]VTS00380.1 unnamed protein product [Tuwongella immobilis]
MNRREFFPKLGASTGGMLTGAALGTLGATASTQAFQPIDSGPQLLRESQMKMILRRPGYRFTELYAKEVEFVARVRIARETPLLELWADEQLPLLIHLHGAGGGLIEGKWLRVVGLIIDTGYGALMVWQRRMQYVEDKPAS